MQARSLALGEVTGVAYYTVADEGYQVVATLAHYAERALSLYQPPYLLLARSLEQPGIIALLTGVQATSMLESGMSTPFSVDHLLPEVTPLLAAEPEFYAYSPEPQPETVISSTVSPYAV